MQFYIYITLVLFGFIFTYWAAIRYIKGLREGSTKLNDLSVIAFAIFFGGPVLLLTYMFPEVRLEDSVKKHRYLISGVVLSVLQITLTVLLMVFNVVIF